MAYGRRDGFSYADDVPIKIIERIKVPPRVALPISFNPSISMNILEDYDFSLEQQVIELSEARRQAKVASEKAKVERVAQEIEHFTQTKTSAVEISKTSSTFPHETRDKSVPTVWKPSQILSPEPPDKKDNAHLHPEIKNTELTMIKRSFNFSDFESQSSSPFDYMELQTLNDIEELNTVFQGIRGPEKETFTDNNFPKNISRSDTEGKSVIPNCSIDSKFLINDYNSGIEFSNRTASESHRSTSPSCLDSQSALNCITSPDICYPQRRDSNQMTCAYGFEKINSYVFQPLNSEKLPYQASFPRTSESPIERPRWNETLPRLRNSKSTSDISVTNNEETYGFRSQTPPPQPYKQSKNYVPTSVNQETNWSSNSNQNNIQQQSHPNLDTDSLPNPYEELDVAQKEFVCYLVSMGFPIDRSARAVKHLGTNEKKVVDHLCQAQGLEESGYNGTDAETALHLYDYNIVEAKKYLNLLRQFQDLGFQKTAVRKALVRHKNDRDKALDFLLT